MQFNKLSARGLEGFEGGPATPKRVNEIAVGTTIADCPQHGPGRALISASGSYLGWIAAKRTACPHTRPPVGHAQTRSVSGACQMEECSP